MSTWSFAQRLPDEEWFCSAARVASDWLERIMRGGLRLQPSSTASPHRIQNRMLTIRPVDQVTLLEGFENPRALASTIAEALVEKLFRSDESHGYTEDRNLLK